MSSHSSVKDIDEVVERLKQKYLEKKSRVCSEHQPRGNRTSKITSCGPNLSNIGGGIDDSNAKTYCRTRKITGPTPDKCPSNAFEACGNSSHALQQPFKVVTNTCERLKESNELQTSRGHSEYELSEGDSSSALYSHSYYYTETDVTLPSNLARASSSSVTKAEAPSGGRRENRQKHGSPQSCSSSPRISQVYQELLDIYDQLQAERSHQLQQAAQLQQRAAQLQKRESLLVQRHDMLCKIEEVEQEARSCLSELKEQHEEEIRQLTEAVVEKTKAIKRMKSSFETLKEMNDSLKKQLNDVGEQNKRLEVQLRKAKARLENFQRKYEYSVAQKGRENIAPKALGSKPSKQEKCSMPGKAVKGSTDSAAIRLLVQMFDWVSGALLVPQSQDAEPTGALQERCSKVLPLLSEQLQLSHTLDPSVHLPLLRFIYWALRQLDGSPQHNTLASTFRRLGEEVHRGTLTHSSLLEPDAPHRKLPIFFKSPNPHIRFLSALIVLKTITQVDILARALESLCSDLRCEEGRALFLEYQALPVLLGHLRVGNRCLLSLSVDALLQMSMESGLLSAFLECCSSEDFFHSMSLLLCSPRLEVTLAEKVSVLLQKLSKIRKNRRLFELFTIHLTVQEMHRTADPSNSFLIVNLRSILFNLGMMKKPALCDSPAASP